MHFFQKSPRCALIGACAVNRANTVNVFWSDSVTMVPEWTGFIVMQIDNQRWLPGAVTKNSKNTKMTVSQEP